jgi:hypothetical protein
MLLRWRKEKESHDFLHVFLGNQELLILAHLLPKLF